MSVLFATFCMFAFRAYSDADDLSALPAIKYNNLAEAPLYVNYNDVHWFEWFPDIFIKLITADSVTGKWVIYLKAKRGKSLGIHRHYGTVWGMCIEGSFGYYEHEDEWMAGQYDVIYETPGAVHTFFVSPDSPTEEALLFFVVEGALEFLDEYGRTTSHDDWMSVTEKYYAHCEKNGLVPHDVHVPRGKAVNVKFKPLPKQDL
eukprot:129160_1